MARKHTCTDCHQPIPAGLAVLRSVALELVAWCPGCWTGGTIVRATRPTLAEPSDPQAAQTLAA